MQVKDKTQTILTAATQEFLTAGYLGADINHIIQVSDIPKETFLSLFPNKAALFEALVSEPAQEMMHKLEDNQNNYFDLFRTYRTSESENLFQDFFNHFINYVYDHIDAFKLIVYHSAGSAYEDYIYKIIRTDASRAEEYFAELRRNGRAIRDVSHDLHHMISSAFFTGVFETIAHDMTRDQAVKYVGKLSKFFFHGWEALIR